MPSMTDSSGLPPQNLDAEQSVIASVCFSSDVLDEIHELKAEHFYADRHQRMFEAILWLRDSKIGIDAVTMAERLERQQLLSQIGNVEYIAETLQTVPNSAHAKYYADIVISKWRARTARYGCLDVIRMIDDGHDDAEVAAKAENVLTQIAERASVVSDVDLATVMRDAWNEIQTRARAKESFGIPTGFADIDRLIVGIQPTELIVIAARPAIGKSAFAACLVDNLARRGFACTFLSLEMSRFEFATRLLSAESGIDGTKLKDPQYLSEEELDRVMRASGVLSELPIRIDETGDHRVSSIAALARRVKRTHGLDVLVIDYLQLVQPATRSAVREQEVSSITRSLKALAKELQIPVIVLAQLNRSIENREDKRPRLADLRESGAIEQDANQVWFLHRPSAYDPADRPGECDVSIAKNRNGKTGVVTLACLAATTQFKDFVDPAYASADRASRSFTAPDWVS